MNELAAFAERNTDVRYVLRLGAEEKQVAFGELCHTFPRIDPATPLQCRIAWKGHTMEPEYGLGKSRTVKSFHGSAAPEIRHAEKRSRRPDNFLRSA